MEEALADLTTYFGGRGIDLAGMSDDDRAAITGRFALGDPDTVGEILTADLARGIDGFTINAIANGHIPGRVELLGRTAAAIVF